MHSEALEKVINIARKNPRILLGPSFFEKISTRLDIDTRQTNDKMIFTRDGRIAETVIINPENCSQYKCIVREGKEGIRIYEFINVLIKLLTDEPIPPSPYEKVGQTADFYCEIGIKVLQEKFLRESKKTGSS